MSLASSNWAWRNGRSEPGGPPLGGQASRRAVAGAALGYCVPVVKGTRGCRPYSARWCAPAFRQPGVQFGARAHRRVDVAVDDAGRMAMADVGICACGRGVRSDGGLLQTGVGGQRVVDVIAADAVGRQAGRQSFGRRRNASAGSRWRTAACRRRRCGRRMRSDFRRAGGVERLHRQADVLAHQFGGGPGEPRRLAAQAAPGLDRAPQEARAARSRRIRSGQRAGSGKWLNTPSPISDSNWAFEPHGLADVVLHEVRRPAVRGGRVAEGAAGVDADGQVVFHRGLVDRPVVAAPEQHLAGGQQLHLHEAAVGGATFDFLRCVGGVLRRHDDGGAQPGILVEPFRDEPVVDGLAQGLGEVLAVDGLAAVQAVDDGRAGGETVQRVLLQQCEVGAGFAVVRDASPGGRTMGRRAGSWRVPGRRCRGR